jgi:hypothetical protein
MNLKNDIILQYLEGQLDEVSKKRFEEELHSSAILQKEIEAYTEVNERFSSYRNIQVADNYFNNIIPRFRESRSRESNKIRIPIIAFGSTVLLITVMFLYLLSNNPENNSNIADNIDENELTELLNAYSSDFILSDNPGEFTPDSTINSLYLTELNVTPETESYYFADRRSDVNTIVKDINNEEADNIYNQIINKKYF